MDDPDFKSDGGQYELDFRVGGHERFSGLAPDEKPYRYDAAYFDIVPDYRSCTATRCTPPTTGCRCRWPRRDRA